MDLAQRSEKRGTEEAERVPVLINNAEVRSQVGLQNVRGSVYYGNVHYHSSASTDQSSDDDTYFGLSSEQRLEDQRKTRFNALTFDQLHIRHGTIENAYQSTCQWFLQREEFVRWLEDTDDIVNHGMLWIKGKPGSGKSTLMKFLHGIVVEQFSSGQIDLGESIDTPVVAFFFNARGSSLEKSSLGAYRALLYQIITLCPDLCTALDELTIMSTSTLQAALNHVASRLESRSLTMFIDALDECDEEEVHEMISFLDDLTATANTSAIKIRICFSSRHFPNITVKHGVSLVLEAQSQHGKDLSLYVQNKLNIGAGDIAQRIRSKLLEKASGIFLWVKLVIQILNNRYRRGRLFELESFLDRVPSRLEELFEEILTAEDTIEKDDEKEMVLCLQWLLFSRRALSPIELYFAVLVDATPSFSPKRDAENGAESDIERYILSCSKGLLEVSNGDVKVVQFIHESVRTFLLQRVETIGLGSRDNYVGVSHARLARCCFRYIEAMDLAQMKDDLTERSSQRDVNEHFPLLSYATTYLLEHGNAAQELGQSQHILLTELNAETLQILASAASKNYFSEEVISDHLLYVLAENNYASLISVYCETCSTIEPDSDNHRYPLFAARNAKNEAAMRALLRRSSSTFLSNETQFVPHDGRAEDIEETIKFLLAAKTVPDTKTPLTWAAENGHLCMVRSLLYTNKVDVDLQSAQGVTPLYSAASRGHEQVVRHLVQNGARINMTATSASALAAAAMNGHIAIVKVLLDLHLCLREANDGTTQSYSESMLDAQEVSQPIRGFETVRNGFSEDELAMALGAAARRDQIEILHLLLAAGANIDRRTYGGENALHLATSARNEQLVAFLLQQGADPNIPSLLLGTPLHIACRNRDARMIELLLDASADIRAASDTWGTPLDLSRRLWRPDIVRILLGNCKDELTDLVKLEDRNP